MSDQKLANHIPGPWRNIHCAIQAEDMDGEFTISVADVQFELLAKDECYATANLIAAAPDMLKALEQVRKQIGAMRNLGQSRSQKILKTICPIIAKARGYK